jgi:hypothetical protein
MRFKLWGAVLFSALSLLSLVGSAQAQRAVINSGLLDPDTAPGGLEGACGIAVGPMEGLYVSDYYHHGVDVFAAPRPFTFSSRIPLGSPSGPCQLAVSASGNLYVNRWHEGVSRVLPSQLSFDSDESTGVTVDQATDDVYVNDRTHIAVYEPSGSPVLDEGEPLRIGVLQDAYGLAYSEGRLYVPDAGDGTVKVYEPSIDTVNPILTIDGKTTPQKGFSSLVDAAVAVDPTNGHVLVLDNLQPGFEHPEAAIDEFDSSGVFLGQLSKRVIDGGPSGMTFSGGRLLVTSGNSDESNVVEFGAYSGGGGGSFIEAETRAPLAAQRTIGEKSTSTQVAETSQVPKSLSRPSETVIVRRGGVEVSFEGALAPQRLPRAKDAPVKVSVAAKISPTQEGKDPPPLTTISIAINRFGHFDTRGLPLCTERDIQPATTQNALRVCKDSLVGVGTFSASVGLSRQSPFPGAGKMYAFNARINGKPAILAHVYGTKPVPTSFTFPFLIQVSKGTFGTTLIAKLPKTGKGGFITGLSMNLTRSYSYKGKHHSYISASCPAPQGTAKAVFPLAKASFGFKGGMELGSTLVRSCGVRG